MRLHVVTYQEPIAFVVTEGKTECIFFCSVDVQLFAAVRSLRGYMVQGMNV